MPPGFERGLIIEGQRLFFYVDSRACSRSCFIRIYFYID